MLVIAASMSASVGFRLTLQRSHGHDHPALAMTALRYIMLDPRLLHRVQDAFRGETFDGRDLLASAARAGNAQERTAAPSTCTVHAPHWAIPQPYLVPVRPTHSRMATKRVSDRCLLHALIH
jgi:hypothetical protein